MGKNKLKTKEIAIAAGLAAISAVVQLIHIGYESPQFGMWIDIVAVTWVVGLFLFGLRISFIVSILGAIIITLFAPDTWLGASTKWLASFPAWFILGIWFLNKQTPYEYYKKFSHLLIPLIVAMIIRVVIILPVDYYYAIPIWTGMSAAKAMIAIPWYIITLFNIAQSAIDVIFAWILVYKFRLDRFASK